MYPFENVAVVVLAGGQGSRLGYTEKALLEFNGTALLVHIIEKITLLSDDIIISVRDEQQEKELSKTAPEETYITDNYKGIGPLAGIEAGLGKSGKEYTLILGCDMPFINTRVLEYIMGRCEGYDVTIPRWEDGKLEPLHAIYRTRIMREEIIKSIRRGERIILAPIFRRKLIRYVDIDELRDIDSELETFKNVNTLADIKSMF